MAGIDISKVKFSEYIPHPFPNPIQGDIVEVEDDSTVNLRYFLVMSSVLVILSVVSVTAILVFIAVLKWRWARRQMTVAALLQDTDPPAGDVQ